MQTMPEDHTQVQPYYSAIDTLTGNQLQQNQDWYMNPTEGPSEHPP